MLEDLKNNSIKISQRKQGIHTGRAYPHKNAKRKQRIILLFLITSFEVNCMLDFADKFPETLKTSPISHDSTMVM